MKAINDGLTSQKRWKLRNPWAVSFYTARHRCKDKNQYLKRGIKFNMSMDDFKYLWFRDKAYLMEKPSIDRINGGDYELSNCRFIELEKNRSRKKHKCGWDRYGICSHCNTKEYRHEAFGLCKRCYLKQWRKRKRG